MLYICIDNPYNYDIFYLLFSVLYIQLRINLFIEQCVNIKTYLITAPYKMVIKMLVCFITPLALITNKYIVLHYSNF